MGDLDLVIRQASLRGRPGRYDVGVSDGRVTAISPSIRSDAPEVVQAEGNLLTESFVNPHLHLDKVYTLAIAGEASCPVTYAQSDRCEDDFDHFGGG
jgi:cytosine deaminase